MEIIRKKRKIKIKHNKKLFWLIIALLILLAVLIWFIKKGENNNSQLANPAAVNCIEKGHKYEIRESPNGQYGICIFSNGNECDAWEYFRGECNEIAEKECMKDEDCVPDSCCHPDACVEKGKAPKCDKVMCTAVCSGPLDCGAGHCGCIKGRCKVIKK